MTPLTRQTWKNPISCRTACSRRSNASQRECFVQTITETTVVTSVCHAGPQSSRCWAAKCPHFQFPHSNQGAMLDAACCCHLSQVRVRTSVCCRRSVRPLPSLSKSPVRDLSLSLYPSFSKQLPFIHSLRVSLSRRRFASLLEEEGQEDAWNVHVLLLLLHCQQWPPLPAQDTLSDQRHSGRCFRRDTRRNINSRIRSRQPDVQYLPSSTTPSIAALLFASCWLQHWGLNTREPPLVVILTQRTHYTTSPTVHVVFSTKTHTCQVSFQYLQLRTEYSPKVCNAAQVQPRFIRFTHNGSPILKPSGGTRNVFAQRNKLLDSLAVQGKFISCNVPRNDSICRSLHASLFHVAPAFSEFSSASSSRSHLEFCTSTLHHDRVRCLSRTASLKTLTHGEPNKNHRVSISKITDLIHFRSPETKQLQVTFLRYQWNQSWYIFRRWRLKFIHLSMVVG